MSKKYKAAKVFRADASLSSQQCFVLKAIARLLRQLADELLRIADDRA